MLADEGNVTLAAGRADARRGFSALHEAGSPVAAEAIWRIGTVCEIEATIRRRPPDGRQRQSLPLIEALQA